MRGHGVKISGADRRTLAHHTVADNFDSELYLFVHAKIYFKDMKSLVEVTVYFNTK